MSTNYHRQHPISHSFHAYGLDGIGTHRADERRFANQHHHLATPQWTGTIAMVRRKLGSLLITAGERTLGEPVAQTAAAS